MINTRTLILKFLAIFILCAGSGVNAQLLQFEQQIAPFIVNDSSGQSIPLPFLGGLNSPVPQILDWDQDGLNDLLLHESAGSAYWFRGDTSARAFFQWGGKLFESLAIGDWFHLVDVDQDGDPDLITDNNSFFRYYENTGTAGEPVFVGRQSQLRDAGGNFVRGDGFSIPAWADIDNDGDPDMFLGRQSGRIYFYEHSGNIVDNVPVYRLAARQYFDLNIQTLGKNSAPRHGANSLATSDIDGDGDYDLLWGDFYAPSLVLIENLGTADSAIFSQQAISEQFPPQMPVMTGGFNVAASADITGDFRDDLIVGVRGGAISLLSGLVENLFFYQSLITDTTSVLQLQTSQLINNIDVGQNSIATFCDLDGDRDSDLFVSNQEDLSSPDAANSRISYFQNSFENGQASYRYFSGDILENDIRLNKNYVPAFGDLDGDSDFDLLVGNWDGKILHFENQGTVQQPQFRLLTSAFADIDVGNNAAPALADLDGDSDLDLLIGNLSGNIAYYENLSAGAVASFQLANGNLLDNSPGDYAIPALGDINGDGDLDLLVGSGENGIQLFRNIGDRNFFTFAIDRSFYIGGYQRMAPALIDADNDSDLDIVSGNSGGGLLFYQNKTVDGSTLLIEPLSWQYENVPVGRMQSQQFSLFNPTNEAITISSIVVRYDIGDFAFSPLISQNVIDPNATGKLTVTFRPEAPGEYAARVLVQYGNNEEIVLPLSASGIATALQTILKQNYPNPFSTNTVLDYELATTVGESGKNTLAIYNTLGQRVRVWNLSIPVGNIRWDGRDQFGLQCAKGIYFARIDDSDGGFDVVKLILLK